MQTDTPSGPDPKYIHNHTEWLDTTGRPIDCHEGTVFRAGAKYYWYGRAYHGNDRGIYGTEGARFRCGFNCYSSSDLVDWTYEGNILSYPESGWMTEGTWHRPRALFNEKTAKYILWFFVLGIPNGSAWVKDVVATADHPAGPFTIIGERKMPSFSPSGDIALLKEPDGSGYLANGDWQRNILIVRLADDFQSAVGGAPVVMPAKGQTIYEGVSLAKFKGKYLMAASGVEGLAPTETTYAIADAPMGPYEIKGLMSEQKTWRSQISSFCHLPETDTLFALCDQWLIGPDGHPTIAEKSAQLWLPVIFDPATGVAKMRYVEAWNPAMKQA